MRDLRSLMQEAEQEEAAERARLLRAEKERLERLGEDLEYLVKGGLKRGYRQACWAYSRGDRYWEAEKILADAGYEYEHRGNELAIYIQLTT